jgi:hypothetical protein
MKRDVGRRAATQGGERHDQRTGTRPVFAQERLAEKRRSPIRQDASQRIEAAARRLRHDDLTRPLASNAHAISKNARIARLLGARRFRAAAETSMTAP